MIPKIPEETFSKEEKIQITKTLVGVAWGIGSIWALAANWKEVGPIVSWLLIGAVALLAFFLILAVIWLIWRFALYLLWRIVHTVSHAWKGRQ